MADNGYGRDTILLKEMIKKNKLLPISDEDTNIGRVIKFKMNSIVLNNTQEKRAFHLGNKKYKYIWNSGYEKVYNTITVVNKLRQQHWYWEYLKL